MLKTWAQTCKPPPPHPRILQNLWGSAGGFCKNLSHSRKPAEEPSRRTPKVLQNFGSQAQLPRPYKFLLPKYHSNRNVYQTSSPEFEVGNSFYNCQCRPKKILLIFKSVIPTGDLALFSRHTGSLVGKFAELPIRNSEEFEVGNGKKNYLHPQKSPVFFARSVKLLVRMVAEIDGN